MGSKNGKIFAIKNFENTKFHQIDKSFAKHKKVKIKFALDFLK